MKISKERLLAYAWFGGSGLLITACAIHGNNQRLEEEAAGLQGITNNVSHVSTNQSEGDENNTARVNQAIRDHQRITKPWGNPLKPWP